MNYELLKSLHIIFVIAWFAGLFYLPRLLVYHAEAQEKSETEKLILSAQFYKMERLLYNAIMLPAMWLTWATGILLIYSAWWTGFGEQSWLHLKLGFVVALTIYHFYCRHLIISFRGNRYILSGNQLRLFNEIATILLVAIVFLVVAKNTMDWIAGLFGFFAFAVLIMLAVKIVKRIRLRS